MTAKTPSLPPVGGSFIIDAKGKVTQHGGTFGPLDPQHEANKPKPEPAAPAPEKGK